MIDSSFIKYGFVGGLCFGVDFIIFYSLIEFFDYSWYFSLTLSFIIATYLNYFLSRKFVFIKSFTRKKQSQIFLTFAVSFFTLGFNYTIIFVSHESFGLNIYLSKFISIFFGFIINYLVRKKIIFV